MISIGSPNGLGSHFGRVKKTRPNKDARALCTRSGNSVEIIGPAESPLAKIRGEHRMQMMIKGKDSKLMHQIAAELMEKHATSTVKIVIDVDPENFM